MAPPSPPPASPPPAPAGAGAGAGADGGVGGNGAGHSGGAYSPGDPGDPGGFGGAGGFGGGGFAPGDLAEGRGDGGGDEFGNVGNDGNAKKSKKPRQTKKARKAKRDRGAAGPEGHDGPPDDPAYPDWTPPPADAPRRKGLRRAALVLAILIAGTIGGGAYTLRAREGEDARAAARDRSTARPAGPGGPVTNVADGARVAPLRRVVPPDVLAVGTAPIPAQQIRRIAGLSRVRDVIAVAGGAVQLQGRAVNALAVDPSAFRSWTPPRTARNEELWTALAADQFVVSTAAADQLRLSKGFPYPVVGRTMPTLLMGGSGALGLPGIDMLVHEKTGHSMGLVPNIAVLVNAPGVRPTTTARVVKKILGPTATVVNLHEQRFQSPANGSYLDLYKSAARTCPGLSWTVLAAIGQVESDHGRNPGRSSAGALGPMQFMPATWKAYGVDGDGDGKADIMNPYDAIPAAARYLCAHGAGKGGRYLYRAIWHYNHADWYVQKVLALAKAYANQYS